MNKREQKIYNYINMFVEKHKYSPSIREIADAVGYKSASTVHRHLDIMKEKGYIDFINSRSRTLRIIQ